MSCKITEIKVIQTKKHNGIMNNNNNNDGSTRKRKKKRFEGIYMKINKRRKLYMQIQKIESTNHKMSGLFFELFILVHYSCFHYLFLYLIFLLREFGFEVIEIFYDFLYDNYCYHLAALSHALP